MDINNNDVDRQMDITRMQTDKLMNALREAAQKIGDLKTENNELKMRTDEQQSDIDRMKQERSKIMNVNEINIHNQLQKVNKLTQLNNKLNETMDVIRNERIQSLRSIYVNLSKMTADNINETLNHTMTSLKDTTDNICDDVSYEADEYKYEEIPVIDIINNITEIDTKCTETIKTNDTRDKNEIIETQKTMVDNAELTIADDESTALSLISYGYEYIAKKYPMAVTAVSQCNMLVIKLQNRFEATLCDTKYIFIGLLSVLLSLLFLLFLRYRKRTTSQNLFCIFIRQNVMYCWVFIVLTMVVLMDFYSCLFGINTGDMEIISVVLIAITVICVIVDKTNLVAKCRRNNIFESQLIGVISDNSHLQETRYPPALNAARFIKAIEFKGIHVTGVYLYPPIDEEEHDSERKMNDNIEFGDDEFCNKVVVVMEAKCDENVNLEIIAIRFCTKHETYTIGKKFNTNDESHIVHRDIIEPPSPDFKLAQLLLYCANEVEATLKSIRCVFVSSTQSKPYVAIIKDVAMDKDMQHLAKSVAGEIRTHYDDEEETKEEENED